MEFRKRTNHATMRLNINCHKLYVDYLKGKFASYISHKILLKNCTSIYV